MLRRGTRCDGCLEPVDPAPLLSPIDDDEGSARVAPTLAIVDDAADLRFEPVDPLDAFASELRARGFAPATVRNRLSILRSFASSARKPLDDVSRADVVEYLGRPEVKPSTRRINLAALRSYYAITLERGVREDDPTAGLPSIRVAKTTPRPFSREQIDAILATGAYKRARAMILLGYYQGFRVSQIAAVHGSHLDLDGGTIRTIGKGGKPQLLPVHDAIAALAMTMPADDWWFPAGGGRSGHVRPGTVTDAVRDAKRRAGTPILASLRIRCATRSAPSSLRPASTFESFRSSWGTPPSTRRRFIPASARARSVRASSRSRPSRARMPRAAGAPGAHRHSPRE